MRLRNADLEAALGFAHLIGDAPDVEVFAQRATEGLHALVPGDVSSYTEVRPGRVVTRVAPADCLFPGAEEVLARLAHENPLIVRARRRGGGSACKISDVLGTREWRRRELCRTLYEPLAAAGDQVAISLPMPGAVVGVTVNRARGTFSDRDCAVLDLVRPHLASSFAAARARQELRARVPLLERAIDQLSEAVVVVGRGDRVETMSAAAARLLRRYFVPPRDDDRLPDELARWVRRRRRTRELADPWDTLAVQLPIGTLHARFVRGANRGADVLVLSERRPEPPPPLHSHPALTSRESQVLSCVAVDMTNARIAARLGIAPRTVKKHLESAYAKLGVHTRAAAVARLLDQDRR